MDPFAQIREQTAAVETLRRGVAADRVASAYLFEGSSGVGKRQAAIALAKLLVAPAEKMDEPSSWRRIEAETHPDVRVFRPRDEGHRNLAVEFVRGEVLPFAQYAPFESNRAVLIFPEADVSFPEQHPEAANAILKTLEEPRAGIHFVLLADRPDRLLRTIRSRCQSVRFSRLSSSLLNDILDAHGAPQEGRAIALDLADGRADRILELMRDGHGEALLAEARQLRSTLHAANPGALVDSSEALARHEHLEMLLEALTLLYRAEVLASCGLGRDPSGESLEESPPLEGATASILRVRQCVDSLEWNANRTSALDAMLFDLSSLARSSTSPT